MTLRKTFDCIYENDMFFLYPLAEVSLHYWRHSSDADDFGGTLAGGGTAVFKRDGIWRPSKIGAGIQFGENFRHSVQFDFAHFSNAGINDHNSGINTCCVSYGFQF
ncbi:MAG: acyloxyacyl hydrolase [Mailhella sp.]|nr:acyloxyacyl hydrolase [Mailhella sp.]